MLLGLIAIVAVAQKPERTVDDNALKTRRRTQKNG